jgi:hypothetical protein
MPTPEVQEFFALIQGGDEGAVEAMLEEMDPFLRRVIRMRLLDGRLRRAVDTTDILQSLLKDFLRQPAAGEPDETSSARLCAYLAAAVRHKVQTRLRKERKNMVGNLPRPWQTSRTQNPVPVKGEWVQVPPSVVLMSSRQWGCLDPVQGYAGCWRPACAHRPLLFLWH